MESYLIGASRYIHLNPLEAHLVTDLLQYPWSSYQDFFGSPSVKLISPEIIDKLLGITSMSKTAYMQFINDGLKRLPQLGKDYDFTSDVAGPPLFRSLTQKKYLRRQRTKKL